MRVSYGQDVRETTASFTFSALPRVKAGLEQLGHSPSIGSHGRGDNTDRQAVDRKERIKGTDGRQIPPLTDLSTRRGGGIKLIEKTNFGAEKQSDVPHVLRQH